MGQPMEVFFDNSGIVDRIEFEKSHTYNTVSYIAVELVGRVPTVYDYTETTEVSAESPCDCGEYVEGMEVYETTVDKDLLNEAESEEYLSVWKKVRKEHRKTHYGRE